MPHERRSDTARDVTFTDSLRVPMGGGPDCCVVATGEGQACKRHLAAAADMAAAAHERSTQS